MPRPTLLVALAGAILLPIQSVFAHGFAGPHMFVSTLIIDDPNVADEASLPTWSYQLQPSDGGLVSKTTATCAALMPCRCVAPAFAFVAVAVTLSRLREAQGGGKQP